MGEGRFTGRQTMKILNIERDHCTICLQAAATCLLDGQVVCYPTETFYALGGLCNDERAMKRIADLKGRHASKPFPLIIGIVLCYRWLSLKSVRLKRKSWMPSGPDPSRLCSKRGKGFPGILLMKGARSR